MNIIFVNNCEAVTKSGIITEDLSDHLAVFANLLIDPNKLDCMITAQDIHTYNWWKFRKKKEKIYRFCKLEFLKQYRISQRQIYDFWM